MQRGLTPAIRRLPRPTDAPLLVLFDGDCGICTHGAHVLRRLDRRGRLDLRPLDAWARRDADRGEADDLASAGAPGIDALRAALHVRAADGCWAHGGAAVTAIACEIPVLWVLGRFGRLPGIRLGLEAGYRVVARNRHRISRRLGLTACRVDNPADGRRA
ncbi:MAG: DCC1-like thiol-disulfide oxidoreductase family protein [Chloroflexota bacterium]